jgi:hypothetical protein
VTLDPVVRVDFFGLSDKTAPAGQIGADLDPVAAEIQPSARTWRRRRH